MKKDKNNLRNSILRYFPVRRFNPDDLFSRQDNFTRDYKFSKSFASPRTLFSSLKKMTKAEFQPQ